MNDIYTPDPRIGTVCTPKMRSHQRFGTNGLITGVIQESPNINGTLRILMDDGSVITELADDWMTGPCMYANKERSWTP